MRRGALAHLLRSDYAIKLTAGDAEEFVPFFVRPSAPKSALCLLIPTASYKAYANIGGVFDASDVQSVHGSTAILQEIDVEIYKNDMEFGLSNYDSHNDGAGVCYSTYRRPIVNMRPKYRAPGLGATWQFPADLSVVGWLEAMNLIEEKNLAGFDGSQNCGEVAFAFEKRAGAGFDGDVQFVGNNLSKRSFSEAWGAV